ncbi:MAG: restriction endonuclease subunit S [Methanobacteriaceae archaeon]|nr:restriction endonuclease subunit S [Methanobacteriaceae archaeon]
MDESIKYPLGDYVKIKNGYAFKSSDFVNEGIPIIRMKDLKNGPIEIDKCVKYPFDSINKFKSYELSNGDILIGMSGSIGKIGLIKDLKGKAFLNQRVGKFEIIDEKKLLKKFLHYILVSIPYQKRLNLIATGATQKNISSKQLESIKVHIPDIETQKKIVKTLEKAEKLKEWRTEADKFPDEYLRNVFIKLFGDSRFNPFNWENDALENLIIKDSKITYGIVQPGDEFSCGVGMIRPLDFEKHEILFDKIKHIDPQIEKKYQRTKLTGKEILITIRGSIGSTCITDERCYNFNVNRDIAVIRPNEKLINIFYLNEFFKSNLAIDYFREHTKGATLKGVNIKDIKALPVLIPPITLQNQFAQIVQQVETLKTHQSKSKQEIDNLFNTVMQKAFKGELIC